MWIKASGALTENVVQISTSVSTHLLILGELAAVVDTGISAVHARLIEELERSMGEGGSLDYILLTHAHF
ncbi:MAG TPA: MBL fold metallo-hydrolase, partial [Oligoflexia bacterium]|nr:MBL fold metallo-hydrolase [Oligoflexia bacterium]